VNDELRRAAAHVLVDDLDALALDDRVEHHLRRVLRIGGHEPVTVTDGGGRWRVCRLTAHGLTAESDVLCAPRRLPPSTIAVAIPKQDRPEWIVQKATELGVDRIVFLEAERSVVRWDEMRAARHRARLERVAAEALMQSRRVWLPQVSGPVPAAHVLPDAVAAEPGGRPVAASDRTVAIGPEGGWTAAELALAAGTVALSDGVLRVETAAVAACVALAG
jgi:16S rRNA (uracil1498-N3)-methyltransferase